MSTQPQPESLIFACSGAADVGEIADRAARELTRKSVAKMFCLAAIGARHQSALDRTSKAVQILAIDGCDKDCAKTCLAAAGFTFKHVRVTDLGLEKGKSPATPETIAKVCTACC